MVKLEKEFQYYLQNQDKLVAMYNGRYIVIKDDEILGDYDTEIEAIRETSEKYALGTFLVQKCEPGSSSYTQTYHSRAVFR